jgi:hypothetical protein
MSPSNIMPARHAPSDRDGLDATQMARLPASLEQADASPVARATNVAPPRHRELMRRVVIQGVRVNSGVMSRLGEVALHSWRLAVHHAPRGPAGCQPA